MPLKDDLDNWVAEVFSTTWTSRDGTVVPTDDSRLGLKNEGIKIDGTVLYADLADSTALVDGHSDWFAAEIYKTFLYCAARIIQSRGGVITAYDGDRVMGVFLGTSKNTSAVKAALQIRFAVEYIVMPAYKKVYAGLPFQLRHVTGIDTSPLFVAKTGVRGANDLVWVGRAANYAAKLSALPEGYTYITPAVFESMNQSMRRFEGKDMWVPIVWGEFNQSTIYRSNWWVRVD